MGQRIVLKNNTLVSSNDSNIKISRHQIVFKKNGDYVIEYVDCDDIHLDISVMDGVCVKLFLFSRDNDLKVSNHYVLGKNSNLILFQFYDNKNVCENSIIDLNGEYSKFYQGFSSISRGNEEYHIIVNHNQNFVCSDIRNKCIGRDGSNVYMQIDSNLEKGNIDCVMDQSSRILTLGDVQAKIVPNMFIDEDSVEARHGSVIGSFDEEEVFYLMSRGISRDEAILLLIKGFLFSNMTVDLEKREFIMNSILRLRR